MSDKKSSIVIGSGLGGLSAAIALASHGFRVEVFEKNNQCGGKLNRVIQDGFSFDLGPSILILPEFFTALFKRAGEDFEQWVPIQPLDIHWRNFFEDGQTIDLFSDVNKTADRLETKFQGASDQFLRFMKHSEKQFNIVNKGFFAKGFDSTWSMIKGYSPLDLFFRLDNMSTLERTVNRYFKNKYLSTIFSYFVKYVGSSALKAPGFFSLLPYSQFKGGLWYVKGGMYNLAIAMTKLLDKLGVQVHLQSEVQSIETKDNQVTGVVVNGNFHQSATVISNMEALPCYKSLLNESPAFINKYDRFEPSCSGIVLHLGLNRTFNSLAHHNMFYSNDPHKQYKAVFDKYELPDDPTIYVVRPTVTDSSLAPPGCDIIKALPQVPHKNDKKTYTLEDYKQLRNKVVDKLERMGLTGIKDSIITEHFWTPDDLESTYYCNKGSIYGVVSDKKKNFALKFPKQSKKYRGLFFTGGSVNPGPGMPMVVLCGQLVADLIAGE